jgi:hypothetical protein
MIELEASEGRETADTFYDCFGGEYRFVFFHSVISSTVLEKLFFFLDIFLYIYIYKKNSRRFFFFVFVLLLLCPSSEVKSGEGHARTFS